MNLRASSISGALRPLALALAMFTPLLLHGHAGHEHGPSLGESAAAAGPLTLPDETIKNLEILTVEAKLTPLQKSVTMAARIEPLPEKHALISPRFEGRVGEILVKLGDQVKAGQPLLKGEPLTVGSPAVMLKSPLDGQVTRQAATLGQSFNADTVLLEVSDHRQIYARGVTYEGPELTKIKKGQPATVKINVLPEMVFTGQVEGVDVGLERESKTFELFALLDNADLLLRPNMQASMTVGIGPAEEVLAVPKRAILGDLGNYFAFVRDGNTFERRTVVLGLRSGDLVEVLEGIFPTDQVVTQGNYQLQYATGMPRPAAGAPASGNAETTPHAHSPLQRLERIAMDRRLWVAVGALIAALIVVRLLVGIFRRPASTLPSPTPAPRVAAVKADEHLAKR
ncbi:MAG TPA: efflux RND transporter periplasmic adaptor subunit [Chthoniobacteraceae bacterium]|nr:efflux RND transporter periplasmic adaptor subunit [Chthoniobacteraceae bacterium]